MIEGAPPDPPERERTDRQSSTANKGKKRHSGNSTMTLKRKSPIRGQQCLRESLSNSIPQRGGEIVEERENTKTLWYKGALHNH